MIVEFFEWMADTGKPLIRLLTAITGTLFAGITLADLWRYQRNKRRRSRAHHGAYRAGESYISENLLESGPRLRRKWLAATVALALAWLLSHALLPCRIGDSKMDDDDCNSCTCYGMGWACDDADCTSPPH